MPPSDIQEQIEKKVEQFKKNGEEKAIGDMNGTEKQLLCSPEKADKEILAEYTYSALETIVNLAWHRKLIEENIISEKVFVPQMIKW